MIGMALQPVPGKLFVEGGLAVPGLISLQGPETGAVGGEHLIRQNDIAFLVQTEFKLGVRDDDAAAVSIFRAFLIQCKGIITKLSCVLLSLSGEKLLQISDAALKGNIFVMIPDFRLGGRGVDGLRQLLRLLQALRQADAADSAVLLIACPAASGDIAPHNAFHRKNVQLTAKHTVAVKPFLAEIFRHILYVYGKHMVRQNILCHIEPEF